MNDPKAALILADGTRFDGAPFGRVGQAWGMACFYTGVVGYQEVLTHPSYGGALVVLTYPIIGSYGINGADNESPGVRAAGLVVREASRTYSSFRAERSLEDLMREQGVVGIREVDTRAVAVHLREHGEMPAAIVPGDADTEEVAESLRLQGDADSPTLLAETTWTGRREPDGHPSCTLALLNLGAPENLLVQLTDIGCAVDVLSAEASAEELLGTGAAGVVLAGGPGDPRRLEAQVESARGLLGRAPLLAVGLGHQVLAMAMGCGIEAMTAGHRGLNYPVRDETGQGRRGFISVQHHRYVVSGDALGEGVEVTHTNANDRTVEGIRNREARAAGVQWHPTRDEMGRPSPLLHTFCEGLEV